MFAIINNSVRGFLMGGAHPFIWKGGDKMTVFEALILMFTFATLIVAVLSEQKK